MATKKKKKAKTKTNKSGARPVTPYRSDYVDYAYEQVEQAAKLLYPMDSGMQIFSRVQVAMSILLQNPTPVYVTITPARQSDKHPWEYYWDSHLLESDRSYPTAEKARASAKKAHDLRIKEAGVPRLVVFDDQQDETD